MVIQARESVRDGEALNFFVHADVVNNQVGLVADDGSHFEFVFIKRAHAGAAESKNSELLPFAFHDLGVERADGFVVGAFENVVFGILDHDFHIVPVDALSGFLLEFVDDAVSRGLEEILVDGMVDENKHLDQVVVGDQGHADIEIDD